MFSAFISQGLVLTILECKGLEFQDVLLYNFFTSSPLATKWRVIYHLMDQKASNSFDKKAYPKFLKFDNGKHNLLCSELKHLYVAITRAKQRLWIYEENRDLAKPILDYWKEMGLIQLRCLDSSLVESMYVASSFEDWKKRGIQMFNEQNYDMAIVCFERARDSNMAKWAKAASLRQSGQRLLEFNPESAKNLLKEAAEIFSSIGKSESAANCYIVLGLNEGVPANSQIVVKRMGDLDPEAWRGACQRKFASNWQTKYAEMHSLWEDYLRDPSWYPFKVVPVLGDTEKHELVVNEDDEKLRDLRIEMGKEVCDTVIVALKELNEYNASGRYPIPEAWNKAENRRTASHRHNLKRQKIIC